MRLYTKTFFIENITVISQKNKNMDHDKRNTASHKETQR